MPDSEYSVRDGWKPRFRPDEIDQVAKALVAVQSEVLYARKDSNNPFHKSKYADLGSVWDAVREPLSKNGLSVLQLPSEAPAGFVGLVTIIMHESGQSISEKFFMPVKDASNPQAVGSALTYARRYALSAALGVCPEDDDGEEARKPAPKPAFQPPKPLVEAKQADVAAYQRMFDEAKTDASRKAVYAEVRNSSVPEPTKSTLLKGMADTIRANGVKS